MNNGTISRLFGDKGFGFIRGRDGREYFFHRSGAREQFEMMREGQAVEFDEEPSPKGPRATQVRSQEM